MLKRMAGLWKAPCGVASETTRAAEQPETT
jgi:hypothetical protein